MIDGEIIANGLDLDFFASDEFLSRSTDNGLIAVRKVLRILMMGWPQDGLGELLNWELFKAVFIERNHALLLCMRVAFQEGFHHIHTQLVGRDLNDKQLSQVALYLSNCLCILPFADIKANEFIEIPQHIDSRWVLVNYKIVSIELTPTSGIEKLFIHENDRVFAYGLEPVNNDKAEPHLIFMGTTYPAGQGFITQLVTDFEGFETAGKKLYRSGHERITAWLDKQNKKVHVCGQSLGGSLSLLLAIDQGKKLSRVDALNPPGLYKPWRPTRYDRWDSIEDKPAVYIQKQGRDQISCFGAWKPEWNVLHVKPPPHKQGPNASADHALNYAGFVDTHFIDVDTDADNLERQWRNTYVYAGARSAIYYLLVVPVYYMILPVLRFALNHATEIALIISTMILAPYIPVIATCILLGFTGLLTAYKLFDSKPVPKVSSNRNVHIFRNEPQENTDVINERTLDENATGEDACLMK